MIQSLFNFKIKETSIVNHRSIEYNTKRFLIFLFLYTEFNSTNFTNPLISAQERAKKNRSSIVSPLHSSRQTCLPRLRTVPDDGRGRRNLEPVWSRNIAGDHESDQTNSRLHKRTETATSRSERNGTRRRVSSREDTNCTRGPLREQGCATSSSGNSPGQDTITSFNLFPLGRIFTVPFRPHELFI